MGGGGLVWRGGGVVEVGLGGAGFTGRGWLGSGSLGARL